MTGILIDGQALAKTLYADLEGQIATVQEARSIPPRLAIVSVGHDHASQVYIKAKQRAGAAIGVEVIPHPFHAEIAVDTLIHTLKAIAQKVDGVIVQLPLPPTFTHAQITAIQSAIDPQQDVDGLHPINVAWLASGPAEPTDLNPLIHHTPCTPRACLLILQEILGPSGLKGRHAVIVNRSRIVGRPLSWLLLHHHATVTVGHSQSTDLPDITRAADILVAATGITHFIKPEDIKPGAIVLDVGISRVNDEKTRGTLAGDVHPDCLHRAAALTPVPGGVGPLTVAMLMHNTVRAALARTLADKGDAR